MIKPFGILGIAAVFGAGLIAFAAPQSSAAQTIKVTLLGTAAGPPVNLDRYEAGTLIEAANQKLLFDCGRGVTFRLAQAGFNLGQIRRLFLTHLHSDHVIGIPDLYLTPW